MNLCDKCLEFLFPHCYPGEFDCILTPVDEPNKSLFFRVKEILSHTLLYIKNLFTQFWQFPPPFRPSERGSGFPDHALASFKGKEEGGSVRDHSNGFPKFFPLPPRVDEPSRVRNGIFPDEFVYLPINFQHTTALGVLFCSLFATEALRSSPLATQKFTKHVWDKFKYLSIAKKIPIAYKIEGNEFFFAIATKLSLEDLPKIQAYQDERIYERNWIHERELDCQINLYTLKCHLDQVPIVVNSDPALHDPRAIFDALGNNIN